MFKYLFLCFALLLIVSPAIASIDTTLVTEKYVDWNLWVMSGVLGLFLFLLSLNPPTTQADTEIDATISVMAWIPLAFCAYASFNVGRIVGTSMVALYSQSLIGILMIVFTVIAVINTFRIVAQHRALKLQDG